MKFWYGNVRRQNLGVEVQIDLGQVITPSTYNILYGIQTDTGGNQQTVNAFTYAPTIIVGVAFPDATGFTSVAGSISTALNLDDANTVTVGTDVYAGLAAMAKSGITSVTSGIVVS